MTPPPPNAPAKMVAAARKTVNAVCALPATAAPIVECAPPATDAVDSVNDPVTARVRRGKEDSFVRKASF